MTENEPGPFDFPVDGPKVTWGRSSRWQTFLRIFRNGLAGGVGCLLLSATGIFVILVPLCATGLAVPIMGHPAESPMEAIQCAQGWTFIAEYFLGLPIFVVGFVSGVVVGAWRRRKGPDDRSDTTP